MFDLWYLRHPPWDSGIVPPEVVDYIRTASPGRALDLGCGSGTSSLALAKANWIVTGIDFAPRAIRLAKQKAKRRNLAVDFRVADVLHLPIFPGPFSLVLDIGCFQGLSPSGKLTYIDQLSSLLAPGGIWMLYGFFKPEGTPGPGLVYADLERASRHLKLLKRQDGTDKQSRPSAWFWFQR
jgi:SAM-dependent methyltransferase